MRVIVALILLIGMFPTNASELTLKKKKILSLKTLAALEIASPTAESGRDTSQFESKISILPGELQDFCGFVRGFQHEHYWMFQRRDYTSLLFAALLQDNQSMARELMNLGADINAHENDKYGLTPSMIAASNGQLDLLKALVKNGARLDMRCKELKYTSANHALRFCQLGCLELLLSRGCYLDITHLKGITAFWRNEHKKTLKMVLDEYNYKYSDF